MSYFHAPAVGRVTSRYGPRKPYFHRGIDIAPPVPGQTGCPVFAAYGGIVRAVRSRGGDRNPITGTWNTGSYILIDGPGGGSEWYGHVVNIRVKPGDKMVAGQRIADMGAVGNVTGIHLHFECWNGRSQGGGADGPGNTRNPALDFAKYGITPGKAGSGGKTPVANKKPATGKADPKVLRVQRILAPMGYYQGALDGIDGPFHKAGIDAYHRAQRYMPGVKRDRVWGPATEAHYQWVRSLQRAMNGWKGTKLAVDGDYGAHTHARVMDLMRRNHGGTYRGKVDNIPGPVFCRMLGIDPHPGL